MNPSSYQKMNEDFEQYLKEKELSKKSISSYKIMINQFLTWLDQENIEADQVSYTDLLSYMQHKSDQGVSQRSLQSYIGTVKHFYDHLIRTGKATMNPATDIKIKGIKRKSLYKVLFAEELHALYNQYPDHTLLTKRNKVILGMLVYQGLKTEEAGKLEVSHINLKQGKLTVPGGIRSNGRTLQLESHQIMDLYDYLLQIRSQLLAMPPKRNSQQNIQTNALFINEGGNCSNFSNIMTQLMKRLRTINSSIVNAKQLRASVIVKWLKTHNLREVQYLAGHRYISSTEQFIESDITSLKEEINQYHPLG